MTKLRKNYGGSYVVENGKTKKVEGTQEPNVSAPRDAKGVRLDLPKPEKATKRGDVARNSGAALSTVHAVGSANTGTKTKNNVPPSTNKGARK